MVETLTRYIKYAIGVIIVWFLLWAYGAYGCTKLQGGDMVPTIEKDAFKIMNHIKGGPESIHSGDIVAFEWDDPASPQDVIAGRVVGVPGDRVKIVNGQLFVNDSPATADYISGDNRSTENMPEVVVPRDHFFVVCDNRRAYLTFDSRGIGPIHYLAIKGKI